MSEKIVIDSELIEAQQLATRLSLFMEERGYKNWKVSGCASRHTVEQLEAENTELKRLDFRQMREMLRAMQAGELTVSRGIEILEMWSAGNWSDDMLPPVRHDLIEEDSMPVEIIDRLKEQLSSSQLREQQFRDALIGAHKALEAIGDEMTVGDRYTNAGQYLIDSLCPSREALALPPDTTALEALIAKAGDVMRERCAKFVVSPIGVKLSSLNSGHDQISEAIRALPGVTLEDLK